MLMQITTLFELRQRPVATQTGRPVSTLAFDWLYTLLLLLFTVGFMLDVWSHSSFGPDQSVLSEYHLLFYTSLAMMGLVLVGAHFRNVGVGYRFEHALPQGYGFALLGVLGFGLAGGLDLVGHALWGFENNDEALLSPTHLAMFITWGALSSGALLAMIARSRRQGRLNLWQSLPGLIGFVAVLVPFTVMLLTLSIPFGGGFAIVQGWETSDAQVIAGFFAQTALVFGFVLWLVRSMRLPWGSFAVIFGLYGLTVGLPAEDPLLFGLVCLLCGIALELAYRAMRPTAANVWLFRAFGFAAPATFWLAYMLYILVTNLWGGIGMTTYMWLGIVFQTGLIGFGIAILMTLAPLPAPEQGAPHAS